MRCLRTYCAFGIVLGLAVGVPTYLSGCDATLQPKCKRYHVLQAKTIDYLVTPKLCSYRFSSKGPIYYRMCFDSAAVQAYMYENATHTCDLSVTSGVFTAQDALEAAQDKFVLGKYHALLVEKYTMRCVTDQQAYWLAVVGIAFFSVACSAAALWVSAELAKQVNQYLEKSRLLQARVNEAAFVIEREIRQGILSARTAAAVAEVEMIAANTV